MEYKDSEDAEVVAARVDKFIDEVVIPTERKLAWQRADNRRQTFHAPWRSTRTRRIDAPQVSPEYGGMGLDFRDVLPTFEAAGRSLLGAQLSGSMPRTKEICIRSKLVATEEQKDEWPRRPVAGDICSGFCMTEPMQGGGSDPKMIQTVAKRDGDEWVINGHKWWTTNGVEADIFLVMARTDFDAHPYSGCSIILVPADTPGVNIERGVSLTWRIISL